MLVIENFLELVKHRRSIRRFKPGPVPEGTIEKILEAGRWTMSGNTVQPWEFIVVQSEATRKQIVDSKLDSHNENYAIEQTRLYEYRLPPLRSIDKPPSFREAPVLIIILGDRRLCQAESMAPNLLSDGGRSNECYLQNMANVTQILHLAASYYGLGSLWVSVEFPWGQNIKAILDIPQALDVHTIIALGNAAYQPKKAYRRCLYKITHYEKYDMNKFRSRPDIQKFLINLRKHTESAYLNLDGNK
ncbi:MAG: nitroreductase family protein [Dehalococcoidales bacterium]|nr:nitroreductase family protein [Dehalococcoidales bacterium]